MSIKLKGSSDGSVSFDAPADTSPSGSDITLTLPTSAGSANQFLKNSGIAGELEYSSMVEDSSNRVGIGTSSFGSYSSIADNLLVAGSSNTGMSLIDSGDSTQSSLYFYGGTTRRHYIEGGSGGSGVLTIQSNNAVKFNIGSSEQARLDSSGRLLVGTSSNFTRGNLQVVDGGAGEILIARNDTSVASGNDLAHIFFGANDGGTGYVVGNISVYSDGAQSSTSHPSRIEFHTVASSSTSATERMRISNNGFVDIPGVYDFTTASAANVNVDSSGGMRRSTSSSKYKTNIETLSDSYSDALLACRPVWYRSTCEGDNPDHSWWGFIAEEVAEIDPRLVHWKTTEVTYNENGSVVKSPCDPEPEGVAYDRFVPHLLNLIKRQQSAIETLETKVETLETQNTAQQTQIDDLLARVTALEAA
jgi:hypothetical protein